MECKCEMLECCICGKEHICDDSEITRLKKENEELKASLKWLQGHENRQGTKLATLKREKDETMNDCDDLQTEIESLQKENAVLLKTCDELNTAGCKLTAKLKVAREALKRIENLYFRNITDEDVHKNAVTIAKEALEQIKDNNKGENND